jgi:hypothetical protein
MNETKEEMNIEILRSQAEYIKTHLNGDLWNEFVGKIYCLNNCCNGDGCGLTGGLLIDMFVNKFLKTRLSEFKECHSKEADCIICEERLSLKKIKGKSTLALNWSKNPILNNSEFTENLLIINLKSGKWWKNKPPIPAGMFFVDKNYCKEHVQLSSNNKSNSIIKSIFLYMMLRNSMAQNLCLEFLEDIPNYEFDISRAFISQ